MKSARQMLLKAQFQGDTLDVLDRTERLMREARTTAPDLEAHYQKAYEALTEARYALDEALDKEEA